MAIRRLGKEEWTGYFNRFSRGLVSGKNVEYAEIRILSDEDGAQRETDWVPLVGISYDARGDTLDVSVDKLDHRIAHPKDIFVDEFDDVVTCLEVVRNDGAKDIIELR